MQSSLHRRDQVLCLSVLAGIFVLFALVGRWGVGGTNIDVIAADLSAWRLSSAGTLEVGPYLEMTPWIVPAEDGRMVSDRPPGLIGVAVPAYWVMSPTSYSDSPGTMTALLLAYGSVVILWMVLRRHLEWRFALAATTVYALGTTTWTISAAQLWPHGPGQFFASLVVAGMSLGFYGLVGAAFAAAVLIRPVAAVGALVTGLVQSRFERSVKPAFWIGTMSGLGVAALVLYNRWLFGEWSVTGGYSDAFTVGAIERFTLAGYGINFAEMFILWPNGILIYSPIIGVAIIGLVLSWADVPTWARSTALAGLAYVLVHLLLNRASGGMPIFYRYPLEAITLAAPALTWGARFLWSRGRWSRRVVVLASVYSVTVVALNAFVVECRTVAELPICFWA